MYLCSLDCPTRGEFIEYFPNLLDYFVFEVCHRIRFDGTQWGTYRFTVIPRPFLFSFPCMLDGAYDTPTTKL